MSEINPMDHVGLCHIVAKRWVNKTRYLGFDYDDLVQICSLVLFTRYKYFDSKNGAKFSTYICKCMNQEVWKTTIRDNKFYPGTTRQRTKEIQPMYSADNVVNEEKGEGVFLEALGAYDNYYFIEKDSYEDLINKINELPQDLKQIVSYRLQGLGQSQISKLINISQSHVSRKLTKVRQIITQDKDPDTLKFVR